VIISEAEKKRQERVKDYPHNKTHLPCFSLSSYMLCEALKPLRIALKYQAMV
jgi:hypothetical protein